MPAPLKVDPISFEEFSRVPMAEAMAKGAGLAALGRIKTDYDVDEADLGKVTEMISGLDQVKDGIVDKIATSNIDSQTVGDVLNLKRQRDELYKTKINAAEQNKKIINNWRENVDRETMSSKRPADYGELIKQRGYEAWKDSGSTFGTEGKDSKTFIPDFGVSYINMDKDVMEMMAAAARQGDTKTTAWGEGTPYKESIAGLGDFATTTGAGSSTKSTNLANITAAESLLRKEYTDERTERGKFAAYAGKDKVLADLDERLDYYKKMFLNTQKETRGGGKHRQFIEGSNTPANTTNTDSYEYNLPRTLTYQGNKKLQDAETGVIRRALNAYDAATDANYKPSSIPTILSFTQPLTVFFSKFFKPKSTDEYKAKLTAIKELNNTAVALKGKTITQEQYEAAMSGADPKAIDAVFDAIVKYQDEAVHNNAASSFDTKDYNWADFGVDTKNDQNGSDIAAGAYNYTDVSTGEFVGSDEDINLNVKAINNKLKVIGNITLGSRDLLNPNGTVKTDLTSGRVVIDTETGKKYYVPLSPGLQKTPNFKRLAGINNTLLHLAPGERTPMVRYNPGTNNFEEVIVKHDDANIGKYVFVLGDSPDEEISIDNYGSELRTKDFYETTDAPQQRAIQKAQVDAYMKSIKK